MARFLVRKLLYAIGIMWLASIIVFLGLRITPGDFTNWVVTPIVGPAVRAAIRHKLGLDLPLWQQYLVFMQHTLTGNLGNSAVTGESITGIILTGAPYTLALAVVAGLITYGIGIPLGVVSALRRRSWIDQIGSATAVVGMGIPNFVLAIVLIMIVGIQFDLLPVSGSGGFSYIILPAIVLAVEPLAVTIRMMRSSTLEQLGLDYVRMLSAKGLPRWRIVWQHVLLNAISPVISLAAVQFRSFLGYTLIVEVIFRWPGLGSRLVNSVLQRDYALAQTLALILTLLVILFNFLADVGHAMVYPKLRARLSGGS